MDRKEVSKLTFLNEAMLDIFLLLDRFHLEVNEYVCRRFREIVREKTTDVCLRPLKNARFACSAYRTHYELFISSDVPSHKSHKTMSSACGSNFEELLDTFFDLVRNSAVDSVDFSNIPMNVAFCDRVKRHGPSIHILVSGIKSAIELRQRFRTSSN